MLNQISHLAGLPGTASLSYDITEFRVEAYFRSRDTAAHKTASRQLRRDEHLPLGDDDHLVQTFGAPSQISPACPTRSSYSCRIPVAVVLASRDITAFCFPST